MDQTARRTPLSTVALLFVAASVVACAEGNTQPTGSTTGGGDNSGGASGDGGSGGEGGSDSTTTKASSSASNQSSSASGGDGGSGGGGPANCGNGTCDQGESCALCPSDCTTDCGATCGDGSCNGAETCQVCPDDCQECTDVCGDGQCGASEPDTCPQDCGSSGPGGAGCPPDVCQPGGSVDVNMCADPCAAFICGFDEACCADWSQSCADAAVLASGIGICPC